MTGLVVGHLGVFGADYVPQGTLQDLADRNAVPTIKIARGQVEAFVAAFRHEHNEGMLLRS